MEATANYLLLSKKHFCGVVMALWFLYLFCCCCCFCFSGLRSTFSKWCTLWECLFCAVTCWILCMGVVYLKKKNKTKTKPPNAWFGTLFWRATLYLKPHCHCNPQKPAASTGPVVILSCGLSGTFLWSFFFSPLRICLCHSGRWPENCDLKTCTARNCQILLKNRQLAHMLVTATFNYLHV